MIAELIAASRCRCRNCGVRNRPAAGRSARIAGGDRGGRRVPGATLLDRFRPFRTGPWGLKGHIQPCPFSGSRQSQCIPLLTLLHVPPPTDSAPAATATGGPSRPRPAADRLRFRPGTNRPCHSERAPRCGRWPVDLSPGPRSSGTCGGRRSNSDRADADRASAAACRTPEGSGARWPPWVSGGRPIRSPYRRPTGAGSRDRPVRVRR